MGEVDLVDQVVAGLEDLVEVDPEDLGQEDQGDLVLVEGLEDPVMIIDLMGQVQVVDLVDLVQVTEDLGDPVEVAGQEELVEGLGELVEGLEGPVEVADQEVDLKDLDCKQELGKNSEFQKDGRFSQICFQNEQQYVN